MKKKIIILVCLLLTMCLYGCSHKSNAELVDVEQFRCQDSIDAVFDVLGETEIKKSIYNDTNYCEYKDVNLFGYNGNLVFSLKSDKKTIDDFDCSLTLNESEYQELMSYFSEQYGRYEVNKFSENLYYSEWTIAEENGVLGYEDGEVGFDTIVFQYNGEKEYTIYFKDEWSYINDEVYFEALEKSQKPESDRKIIQQQEYEYDDITMHLTFSEDEEGLFYFSITLNVEEKWKGAGVYTYVASFVKILNEQLEAKGISSTVLMICDDAVISNIMSYTTDGELVDVAAWIVEGCQDENFDADVCLKLWEQMEYDIYYFLMGDEYLEYKND